MTLKKTIGCIIILLSSISISNWVSAFNQGGYIDELLEIPTGVEAFEISLPQVDIYNFRNSSVRSVYENFSSVHQVLRQELLNKYANGDFEYYQMQGIIKNYSDFVYHTNKLFGYLEIRESGISGKTIDTAIIRSYQNIRISYNRMRNTIARNY